MPKFETHLNKTIYASEHIGAVLDNVEDLWYPFTFFVDGELDVDWNNPYNNPHDAYRAAQKTFT
jgi:hypothetical protein